MSGVLIVKPEPIVGIIASGGSGVTNLATPDPKEVWVAPNSDVHFIDVDMGQVISADSFSLVHSNATADARWAIHTVQSLGDQAQSTGWTDWMPMRAADSLGPRHHAFVRLAQPVVSRFFRIIVDQGGATPLYAGALILGRAFEKHRERGADRTLIDTGIRQDLPGGGFNMGDGVVKTQFSFSFVDLTDAERAALFAIKKDRGLRRPVLLVEDADLTTGQNEAIHYGVFERFQAYERLNPRLTRWAGSVLEWV